MEHNDYYDVDFRNVSPDVLVDINDVMIDETLPTKERLEDFIRQVKNPLCYKSNGVIIKNVYSQNGTDLEECFRQIVMSM